MPSYSLDLARPGQEPGYVVSHEFPGEMRDGDRFQYDGRTWQVVEVATKQFDRQGEPNKTLHCIPV